MQKNERDEYNTASIIIVVIMLIGFISICYQVILKNVCVDIFHIKASWVDKTITSLEGGNIYSPEAVGTDWKIRYPFRENSMYEQQRIETSESQTESEGKIQRIYTQFEKYSTDYFMFRNICEIVSKEFSKCLGMNIVTDSNGYIVYEMSDGRYSAERPYKSSDIEAQNIISLSKYLETVGVEYVYIAVPAPVDPDEADSLIARGYNEYSNAMMDELLTELEQHQIVTLDLRQQLKEENISWSDVFFRSDHHWKPEYGIWGAKKISDTIDGTLNLKSDKSVFDIDNYTIEIANNVYMGGFGKSLTTVYVSKDDMEIWSPKFRTDIYKTVPKYDLKLNGEFRSVIYDMTNWPTYNIWNHGIQPIKTYNNSLITDNVKILLLTESYSDVVSPFLACAYSNIEEIDLRCFDGSLETYIEEMNPDIVVTIYSAYDFNSGSENSLYYFK